MTSKLDKLKMFSKYDMQNGFSDPLSQQEITFHFPRHQLLLEKIYCIDLLVSLACASCFFLFFFASARNDRNNKG